MIRLDTILYYFASKQYTYNKGSDIIGWVMKDADQDQRRRVRAN